MTPTAKRTLKIQDSFFDLERFDEVSVMKTAEFTPVENEQEALAKLGNDPKRLLAVINKGLEAEARRELRADMNGWMEVKDDDSLVPFTGKPADIKKVNSLILTLAKTVFGFGKDKSKEEKKAAKEQAFAMVSGNEAIRNGLATSAAITIGDDSE